jgi:hypothetical protein
MNAFIKTIRVLGVTASVAISLTSFAAYAEGTAEQRNACMGDAFRLCASHIPNVEAITACMRTNKSKLSPACKLVFDKTDKKTVASRKETQTAE